MSTTTICTPGDGWPTGVAMGVIRGPRTAVRGGWDNEVHTDKEEVGRRAMLSLLALLRGEPGPVPDVAELFRVIPRGSSGPAPR